MTHPEGDVGIDGGNAPRCATEPMGQWGATTGRGGCVRAHLRETGRLPLARESAPAAGPPWADALDG